MELFPFFKFKHSSKLLLKISGVSFDNYSHLKNAISCLASICIKLILVDKSDVNRLLSNSKS